MSAVGTWWRRGRTTAPGAAAASAAYYRASHKRARYTPSDGMKNVKVAYIPRGIRYNPRSGGFNHKEMKFYDTSVSNFLLDSATGGCYMSDLLSTPAQGSGPTERNGRTFWVKSILAQGSVQLPTYNSVVAHLMNQDYTVYVYLVLDTQINRSSAAYTDYRDNGTVLSEDFIQMQNTDRFKTLARGEYTYRQPNRPLDLSAATPSDDYAGTGVVSFKLFTNFKKYLKVMCDPVATSSGGGATMDNGVRLAVRITPLGPTSLSTYTVKDPATINWRGRCRFCC